MATRSKGKPNSVSNEKLPDQEENEEPNGAEILRLLKKLDRTLNDVKAGQSKLEEKLESLTTRLDNQHTEIKDLQKSANFFSHEISVLSKSNATSLQVIKEQQCAIDDYAVKLSELQTLIDDTQRYSRGFNLRFVGLPEEEDPQKEDCIEKIQQLIFTRLQINADIENAHRVGRVQNGKPRHVIAKFLRRPERYSVLRQRYAFKVDKVMVFEDVIAKDLEARRKLAAVVQDARQNGKKTRFVKGDLIIEGKKYTPAST